MEKLVIYAREYPVECIPTTVWEYYIYNSFRIFQQRVEFFNPAKETR